MPKTVVFYGNCQAQALCELYRRSFAATRDETTALIFVGDEQSELLWQADVFVEQIFGTEPRLDSSRIKSTASRHRFPLVLGTFLWPFASQPHVRNESYPFLPGGPYPAELGDSFLNRLVDRIPVADAVAKYTDLDMASHAHLDRLYEVSMAAQRDRDRLSDMNLAQVIEANFRTEAMFLTRGHPTRQLFNRIARSLYTAMGIPDDEVDAAINSYYHSVFPWDELPIHPNTIEHYGLTYVKRNSRYRYMQEGSFTFNEYAGRYLRYDWNRDLYEGIQLANYQISDEAFAKLTRGLAISPLSEGGLRAKGELHLRSGDLAAARCAALRAIAAHPGNPENHGFLATVMVQQDDLLAAEAALRTAIELHPLGAKYHSALADILSRSARSREAVDAARFARQITPGSAHAHALLGYMLQRDAELDGAEQAFRQAIGLLPDFEDFRIALASVLEQKERRMQPARTEQ